MLFKKLSITSPRRWPKVTRSSCETSVFSKSRFARLASDEIPTRRKPTCPSRSAPSSSSKLEKKCAPTCSSSRPKQPCPCRRPEPDPIPPSEDDDTFSLFHGDPTREISTSQISNP